MPSAIIATRAANALISEAEAELPALMPHRPQVEAGLGRFKAAHGGLWVGGRATLTAESLLFRPNALNRGLHTGALDVEIPMGEIARVEVRPALGSSVIVIAVPPAEVKIRCWRADEFARQIAGQAGVDLAKAEGGRFRMRLSGD
jgi:hypothetical protein